jgi:hypothetical protein
LRDCHGAVDDRQTIELGADRRDIGAQRRNVGRQGGHARLQLGEDFQDLVRHSACLSRPRDFGYPLV